MWLGDSNGLSPVGKVGADQTPRNTEPVLIYEWLGQSTQPGTAGGVMSWTFGTVDGWGLGAVAFKPAAVVVVIIPVLTTPPVYRPAGIGERII
mgnify:CR=1 FL=1